MSTETILPITSAYLSDAPLTTGQCLALVKHLNRLLERWDSLPEAEKRRLGAEDRRVIELRLDYLLDAVEAAQDDRPAPVCPPELAIPS
ncbi:MAG TPA: hypothetical protein VMF91_07525 [Bryobacteraceae bacterium]|nr:hypothetical protein [Bryobacteraceae bacterium]